MKKDDYSWWMEVFRNQIDMFDIIRLDHFRGFAGFWKIKATEKTAINGFWEKGPGASFFEALLKKAGTLPFIAEDLGVITDDVIALREQFNFPGMNIMQFSFDTAEDTAKLPCEYDANSVVYTGTHDNDTSRGWFKSIKAADRKMTLEYLNCSSKDVVSEMVRCAFSCPAALAILPLQDILDLDSSARINIPGRFDVIYRWRLGQAPLKKQDEKRLANLVRIFRR